MEQKIELEENKDGTFGDQNEQIILVRHAESEANMILRDKNLPIEEKLKRKL